MTILRLYFAMFTLLSVVFLGSCSSEDEVKLNADIPADPGTDPPPPATGPLIPTITLIESDANNPGRVSLIVGGVGYQSAGSSSSSFEVVQYDENNLVVVEDEVVQGKLILEGSTLKADFAFIIDNSTTMVTEIRGVRESVLNFVEALRSGGQDVAAGVVAFNDELLPDFANNVPASDTRAKPAVYGYVDLSADLDQEGDVYAFVDSLTVYESGRNGDYPELAFAGVDFARRNFSWREGAQRIYIVITDDSSWGQGYSATNTKGIDEDYFTDETLGKLLKEESSVVHVYSPAPKLNKQKGEYDVKPLADLTGGIWNELETSGEFNLLELGIVQVTVASSRIEFVKNGDPNVSQSRRVRIVVSTTDDQQTINGERSIELTY